MAYTSAQIVQAVPIPAGGSMTLLSTTTLSGASTTISSISGDYINLVAIIRLPLPATDQASLLMRFNSDSAMVYRRFKSHETPWAYNPDATSIPLADDLDNTVTNTFVNIQFFDYTNTNTYKVCQWNSCVTDYTFTARMIPFWADGIWYNTSAISSITFSTSSGNWTSGTVLLYGVK